MDLKASHRALVIGGSLGGLFAAGWLRRVGWHVTVFERVEDDLASRGASARASASARSASARTSRRGKSTGSRRRMSSCARSDRLRWTCRR
jgi:2-polyprenyl-6-methoxyphenol hydroxylase-like FAD-dependent oxidoreductase